MSTARTQTMDKPNQYAEYTLFGMFANPTVDEDTGVLREKFTWRGDLQFKRHLQGGFKFKSELQTLIYILKKQKKKLASFTLYANWRPRSEQVILTGFGDAERVVVFPHCKPEVLQEIEFLLTNFKIPYDISSPAEDTE